MSMFESPQSNNTAAGDIPPPYEQQDFPPGTAPSAQGESQLSLSNSGAAGEVLPPYHPQDLPRTVPPAQNGSVQSTFYHVYRTTFGNYSIQRDDDPAPGFYVNIHKLRAPDMVIHRGNGDYDREVATCKLPQYGGLVEMDILRKLNDRSSFDRVHLTTDGRFSVKMSAVDTTGTSIHTERSFAWRIPGTILIDEETDQMVAMMQGVAYGLAKCFVLEIQAPRGSQLELVVLCSAMVMYESQRREYTTSSGSSHRRRRAGHHSSPWGNVGGSATTGFSG